MSGKLFTTVTDARDQLSGTIDWEWGGKANHNDYAEFAWRHQDDYAVYDEERHLWSFDKDAALIAYLRSVGEDPNDYGLR